MVTYEKLSKRPQAVPSLIGMSITEFNSLYQEFEVAHAERLVLQPDLSFALCQQICDNGFITAMRDENGESSGAGRPDLGIHRN